MNQRQSTDKRQLLAALVAAVGISYTHSALPQSVFGLGGYRPVFPDGPNDLIGVRYSAIVIVNQSQSLRIVFGFNRLHQPGSAITYLIESNIYSGRYTYQDNGCTTWPLLGVYTEAQSSLRNAIPDYPFYLAQTSGITTGIKTLDATGFPVQNYLIDNITNLYKSDAITQFSVNGAVMRITLERGPEVIDVSSFTRCGRSLVPGTYRKWVLTSEISGRPVSVQEFVVPESSGKYLTVNEAMNFASEYIHNPGTFTVQFWDQEFKRESDPGWNDVVNFTTSSLYDGNGSNFGVRVINTPCGQRAEFSNVAGNSYLPRNTLFTIQPGNCGIFMNGFE